VAADVRRNTWHLNAIDHISVNSFQSSKNSNLNMLSVRNSFEIMYYLYFYKKLKSNEKIFKK